jgi:hypothetical protein
MAFLSVGGKMNWDHNAYNHPSVVAKLTWWDSSYKTLENNL